MTELAKILPSAIIALVALLAKDFLMGSSGQTNAQKADSQSPEPVDTPTPVESTGFENFEEDDDEYEPPVKVKSKHQIYNENLHITFKICTSWGYKNAFNQYQQILANRYGDSVQVSVEQYPVDPFKQAIAQVLTMLKLYKNKTNFFYHISSVFDYFAVLNSR